MKELYACLCAKEFPVQALLRLRPEMREQSCAVLEGEPPLEVVCSLNRRARSLGVARGISKVEVETLPDVTLLRRSRDEEAAAKAALLECAGGFSPRVEDASRDGLFLCAVDIAGTEKLFGAPEVLARNLLQRVWALGISACVAVSGNFHAAMTMARGLTPRTRVRVIEPGEEAEALAELPLAVLEMSEEQAEVFGLWGIRTLGMLASLPEKELIARMGQAGGRLRQMARGERRHLLQPQEMPFALEERMELEAPVEALDALLFAANRMLEQLTMRASARVLALESVTVEMTKEGGGQHVRTVRPALPSNERTLWLKLLQLDLEAHPPAAAIVGMALRAEPGSTSKVQMGLFSPQLPEASRLDVTLARIRAMVGEENAGRAVLEDTHRADGFRMEAFSVPATQAVAATQAAVGAAASTRAGTRRLRPAERVRVTLAEGRPKAFVFRERRYRVDRAYGPWLTSGEWWNASLWGCEEWDAMARAEDRSPLCCRLVRDVLRDEWRMAALYD